MDNEAVFRRPNNKMISKLYRFIERYCTKCNAAWGTIHSAFRLMKRVVAVLELSHSTSTVWPSDGQPYRAGLSPADVPARSGGRAFLSNRHYNLLLVQAV